MRRRSASGRARRVVPVLGLVIVLLAVFTPVSALAAAPARSQPAPVPSATPLLIGRAQLGSGWAVSAPALTRVPQISCHALPAALASARRRAAAGATFAPASAGPYVQQTVYRWASAATATAVWRRVARPALLGCLAQSLVKGGSSGVSFTVTGRHQITAPHLAVGIRAYRVLATATIGGQGFPAYLDELVINTGGSVSEVSVASYEQPPPAAVERRVASAIARRASAVNRRSAAR
ncbi:MAG TPA: hypothetical protein VFN55_14365 [Solirubrobacteraceae bacterium]|nr:hypothetical protein [Solirubrobacteraceae bacterium]